VRLLRLALTDFRNYRAATLEPAAGLTVVTGANGQGKTNLAEALAWLATLESFRGAPNDAMVRDGAHQAVVRGEVRHGDGRQVLIEGELGRTGKGRVHVNRQSLPRARDLVGALRVTVFSPDDLAIVKGGPGGRRRFLDDLLAGLYPRLHAQRGELDRILRQRGTLLRQAGGRFTTDIESTLDVWDAKLAAVGTAVADDRCQLVDALLPSVIHAFAQLSGEGTPVGVVYDPPWRRVGLASALAASRRDDVRRQQSLVGPHRDEVEITVGGSPARTHASQGEQRSLAIALRLAAHAVVTARTSSTPVLVLDDVFSELDVSRSATLVGLLPDAQVLVTTAGPLPQGVHPGKTVVVRGGEVFDDG
jgi:DNA replication and repair protein RecF